MEHHALAEIGFPGQRIDPAPGGGEAGHDLDGIALAVGVELPLGQLLEDVLMDPERHLVVVVGRLQAERAEIDVVDREGQVARARCRSQP